MKRRSVETPTLHAVRFALASREDVLLHRNNTGVDLARGVRYGLGAGGADLVGVLTVRGVGVALHVEVKAPGGRLSRAQRSQREMLLARGAVHIVARSADEAIADLERARCALLARIP